MKLFYTLAGVSLAQEKYCQPGRAIGIDKDGNVDTENTENCYVTKEAAQVTRCNEVGGTSKVEMGVKVMKALFPLDWNPADHGFTEDPTDTDFYTRVYVESELAEKFINNQLVLQAGVPFTGEFTTIGTEKIYTKVDGALSFRCVYPLGIRTVTDSFSVTGQDVEIEREGTGTLSYAIQFIGNGVSIGDWNEFKVVPANPGLPIHARVQSCSVANGEGAGFDSLTVFGNDGNFCRNKYLNFTVVSGHGGTGEQVFKYTAFKWSTDRADVDPETQYLSCVINIQKDAFSTVNTPYCSDQYN